MDVIFIRHTPTHANQEDVFMGLLDYTGDTTYMDNNMSIVLEARNAICNCVQTYSSPLLRARQTAQFLSLAGCYVVDQRLSERDLGRWSGIAKSEVRLVFPEAFYADGNLDFRYTPPGGEAFGHMVSRVAQFLISSYRKYGTDCSIAVVTHNGVITVAKCLESMNFEQPGAVGFYPFLKPNVMNFNSDVISSIEQLIDKGL